MSDDFKVDTWTVNPYFDIRSRKAKEPKMTDEQFCLALEKERRELIEKGWRDREIGKSPVR